MLCLSTVNYRRFLKTHKTTPLAVLLANGAVRINRKLRTHSPPQRKESFYSIFSRKNGGCRAEPCRCPRRAVRQGAAKALKRSCPCNLAQRLRPEVEFAGNRLAQCIEIFLWAGFVFQFNFAERCAFAIGGHSSPVKRKLSLCTAIPQQDGIPRKGDPAGIHQVERAQPAAQFNRCTYVRQG